MISRIYHTGAFLKGQTKHNNKLMTEPTETQKENPQ